MDEKESQDAGSTGQDLTVESKVKNYFGVKVFIGYNITEKFNLSVSNGFEYLTYTEKGNTPRDDNQASGLFTAEQVNYKEQEIAPSFCLAAGYNINENISLKLSYDYVIYNKEVKLHTLRVGVNYMF